MRVSDDSFYRKVPSKFKCDLKIISNGGKCSKIKNVAGRRNQSCSAFTGTQQKIFPENLPSYCGGK